MNGRTALSVLAVVTLLGAGAAWLRQSVAPAAIPPAGTPIALPPIILPALSEPAPDPASDLADALSRPPFAPSRRPPRPAPAPVEVAAIAASAPVPVGIVTGGEEPLAILRIAGAPRPLRARLGETIGGWQLLGIEPGALLMRDPVGGLHRVPLARPRAGDAGAGRAAPGRGGAPAAGAADETDPMDDETAPVGDEEMPRGRPNLR